MRLKFVILILLLVSLLAACGGGTEQTPSPTEPVAAEPTQEPAEAEGTAEETAPGELPMPDPLAVSGDIITAGSSTVFPLSERMAERYQNESITG